MSTIVASINLSKTEARIRQNMITSRTPHRDVDTLHTATTTLEPGESLSFFAGSFFYACLRDAVDVEIECGTPLVTSQLTAVSGMLAFPFPCRVTLKVGAADPVILPRQVEVFYS